MGNNINLIYGGLAFVIGAVVHCLYAVISVKVKGYLVYIESKTGENFYNQAKVFVESLAKLHPEDFEEDKIVTLLDGLDNKFGNHLSRNTIHELVDFAVKTIQADVAKEVVK